VKGVWRVILLQKGLVLFLVAVSFWGGFDVARFHAAFARWPQNESATLSSRFSTWDIAHYLRLSQDGYEAGSPSCAFYPLWPAVLRVGTVITGNRPVLAAMLLANALSLVGLWLLYRLVERRCGAAVSRDSLILLLAFPGALFFSFPYSESLYLVLLMLFFWSLELRRWFWLAVAGFLLPLARPVGVFIVLPLAWFLFEQWRKARSHEILGSGSYVEPLNRGSRRESAPASSDSITVAKSNFLGG
jgi:Gpi18-like mannosyltransferase